jgi:hypothetical protein
MKTMLPILLSTILIGCTAEPPKQATADASAPGGKSCISLDQIVGKHIVPPNAIMFEVVGPVNFRNELMDDCPGLTRLGSTAAVEYDNPLSKLVCKGDRVRIFDPIEARTGGIRASLVCRLGTFVPVPRN